MPKKIYNKNLECLECSMPWPCSHRIHCSNGTYLDWQLQTGQITDNEYDKRRPEPNEKSTT